MRGNCLRLWAHWVVLAAGLCAPAAAAAEAKSDSALPAFTEAEWTAQVAIWRETTLRLRRSQATTAPMQTTGNVEVVPGADAASSVALLAPGTVSNPSLDAISVQGTQISEDSITNVQTVGVDEGGIVKQHGNHLVVLRRGRLFSIDLRADTLKPVAAVDAFGPGIDPKQGWYDEMLISGDTIVVVGFHYGEGATGIGLFDIDEAGAIRYRDTYFLRSEDYYSSSNSASRLIGQTLIFYSPVSLHSWKVEHGDYLPSMGRHAAGTKPTTYVPTLPITRIYRSRARPMVEDESPTLHVVTRCTLSQPAMDCESSAVLGPPSRQFYVSNDAAYVWTTDWPDEEGKPAPSSVMRLPLDGSAPSQLQTSGGPIDQLSFLQGADDYLNVLLVAESRGDGMWASEINGGDAALLRVPLSAFGGLTNAARTSDYRSLPRTQEWDSSNRFVGDWLVYSGDPESGGTSGTTPVHAVRYAANEPVQTLRTPFVPERIEAMGGHGILVGADEQGDLHFASLRLEQRATLASSFIQPGAAQGESRRHGFFYRPANSETGILGLPIVRALPKGMQRYVEDSAAVVYLRNQSLRLTSMGQLEAAAVTQRGADDGCKASCVDWYGNARPIFIGQRVFALLGYELVEGEVVDERIRERRRVDFNPRPGFP